MSFWFFLSVAGLIAVVPLHFLSVEHGKLDSRYGKERGFKIGAALGMASGWGFFLFLFGLWISPQPKFAVMILGITPLGTPISHYILAIIFLAPGAYLGIKGVTEMGLKEAETHRVDRVISSGVYSRIRHPQYLGAILSHIGASFLLSGYFSLLVSPVVIIINYILCLKEEQELIREFGEEYQLYRECVPMLIPKIRM
ncbi:MAG: methyltransferase family protein [Candidatus Thorarchaeota archaeon]|jgi:protein-S-isoprenylcysteine O-methyltransferase Ste14